MSAPKASASAAPDAAAPGQSDAPAVAKAALAVAPSGAVEARPPEAESGASSVPPTAPSTALSALPDLSPLDPGAVAMEVPARRSGGAAAPAAADPALGAPGLTTSPLLEVAAPGDSASGGTAGAPSAVTASKAGAASAVTANALVANPVPSPAELPAGAAPAPSLAPAPLAAPGLPTELEAPRAVDPRGLAKEIGKIRGKPGIEAIKEMGGDEGTEGAIGSAIKWLVENQEPDGRWASVRHGAKENYDTGATGLALLCFYGWGERHDRDGKYRDPVRRAIDWLVAQQGENGYLGGRPGMMYSHAIATIALCEAYGLTKDRNLKAPAERAIAYTLAAQSKSRGGWRYTPGEDSDTSVTGWQFMALHSARLAGLEVPEENFERARRFLDQMGGGKHGGLYGYQEKGKLSRAMVATGMFCRQLDLVPPSDPRQQESARLLKMHPMKPPRLDLYYVYYATLALYQHQGPIWADWNTALKENLTLSQHKTGAEAGSWDPSASMTADGGRVVSTALATLSLEVYYRLLPMYGFRNTEAEAPEVERR